MVVTPVGFSPRPRRTEDLAPPAPVLEVTNAGQVATDESPSPVGSNTNTNTDRFRTELTTKDARALSGATGTLRIGVGFVLPKFAADALQRGLDQLTVHQAKSFFELPSDVQNAVKDEMKKWPSDSKAYKNIVQLATSNGFLQHSPAVQKAMVAGISKFPKDASFHKEMYKTANDPDFIALSEPEKLALISGFVANGADKVGRRTICEMINSSGFKLVPDKERLALIEHVAGTDYFGKLGRANMRKLLDSEAFQAKSPDDQAALLKQFVVGQHFSPESVDAPAGSFDKQVKYSVPDEKDAKEAKRHKFYSGRADALRYDVMVDGQTIPVHVAKKFDEGLQAPKIEEIAKALASLPKDARKQIKSIDVEPHRDPDDAEHAKKSGDPEFRAFMAADESGVVNIFPTPGTHSHESITGSLLHETGHTISRREWGANSAKDKRWDPYKEAIKSDGPPPSKYGGYTIREDFAETWALYLQVKGTPKEAEARKTFPARFALIDQLLAEKPKK